VGFSTGIDGRVHTAAKVANRVMVSIKYSQEKPTSGISIPPTSGPAIAPAIITVILSALAAGNCWVGRSLGRTAVRIGWFTAKNACCRANMPSRSHTSVIPTAA